MTIPALATLIADKTLELFVDKFKEEVFTKWSRYRAQRFFDSFVEGFRQEQEEGATSENMNRMITDSLDNPDNQEVLFDAYRRVVLSKSREVGPRIIGLLLAKIISENRIATEAEEMLIDICEIFSDRDFSNISAFIKKHETNINKDNDLVVEMRKEGFDTHWAQQEGDVSPINFREEVGEWAQKLNKLGAMWEVVFETNQTYDVDHKRERIESGEVRTVARSVVVQRGILIISEYIERVDNAYNTNILKL